MEIWLLCWHYEICESLKRVGLTDAGMCRELNEQTVHFVLVAVVKSGSGEDGSLVRDIGARTQGHRRSDPEWMHNGHMGG